MIQLCATEKPYLHQSAKRYGDSGARAWRVASAGGVEPLMIGKPKPVLDVIVIASLTPRPSMHSLRGIAPRLLTRSSVLPPLPLNRLALAHRLPTLRSPFSLSHSLRTPIMDDNVKQHYLADSPPTVVRLEIKSHFDTLKDESLRRYAHYMSR